ncbi:MAG TPA: hypothetical protein VF103_02720 [Polyangiaceae bacterium]
MGERFHDRRRTSHVVKALLFAPCLALTVFFAAPRARAAEAPDLGNDPYQWNYVFPITGTKLASKGIRFPFPFGIGLNYLQIVQNVNIDSVRVAVNDSEYVDLSKILKFDSVTSNVKGLNARFDLWVLPFLNVYGLANYIADSDTDVLISEPFDLRAGASQTGYGGGFGATGAFGAFGFFVSLDTNFTWNQMQKLDAPVRTFVLAPRIGKRFHLGGPVSLAGWFGAMRQDIEADTSGSINLADAVGGSENGQSVEEKARAWYDGLDPVEQRIVSAIGERLPDRGDPIIHYKLDKALADPWNLLIGMEADFSQRYQIRTEFGFLGRTQFLLSLNYRFGLIPK